MSDQEDEDWTFWRDLFSGETQKVTIATSYCSTSLWRKDQWEPVFGKDFTDKLPDNAVYEITHKDFVAICSGISKELSDNSWHPTPAEVAKACDTSGSGGRWFRMSDAFSEFIGRATPIIELDVIVD